MKVIKKLSLVLAAVMAVSIGGFAVGCAPADEGNVNNPPIEKPDDGNPDETPGGETPDEEEPDGEQPALTHDPVTLEVTGQPGTYRWHNFVDGKCEYCSKTTIFHQEQLKGDELLTTSVPEEYRGTVTSFSYQTRSYYTEQVHADLLEEGQELWVTKRANVYLPAGYDPEDEQTRYDVLYLMHGTGLNENYWFACGEAGDGYGEYTPENIIYSGGYGTVNVLDHLMMAGLAEKTIIVTPTLYSPAEKDYGQQFAVANDDPSIIKLWWKEFKYDLMPYVAAHFNTYARVTDDMTDEEVAAELIKNRDHQGYAGLSMGGSATYASIWAECTDYISYIGTFSGGGSTAPESFDIAIEKKNGQYADYDINYWFVGAGTAENPQLYFDFYYRFLTEIKGLQHGSDIANGDNCEFCVTNRTGHNYATWITALYNSMLVFFKAD